MRATLGAGFVANITIPTTERTNATNRDAMKVFLIISFGQTLQLSRARECGRAGFLRAMRRGGAKPALRQ
jgi:hypothetical protein